MALEPTGYLDFSWSPTPDVDGYKVKLYKNNSYYQTNSVYSSDIRVSGLLENESIRGLAYPFKGDSTFSTFTNLETQVVPVSRLEDTFSFVGVSINGSQVNLSQEDGFVSGQYYYSEPLNEINLFLTNPRHGETVIDFYEDPLLKSINYDIYTADDNVYLIESNQINSLSYNNINTGDYGRNYVARISVNDFFNSGVTGNISFLNNPISINSTSTSYVESDNQAVLSVFHSYSTECYSLDYIVYENNDCTGEYFLSGSTESVDSYSVTLPSDFSGAIKSIPNDWYGSGYHYITQNVNFALLNDFSLPNNIKNAFIGEGLSYSSFNVLSSYEQKHSYGSYFTLSITSDPIPSSLSLSSSESSLSTMSSLSAPDNTSVYFEGQFDDLTSGYLFDFFPFIDPLGPGSQDFYCHINLYQSGSHTLEDTQTISGSLASPHFNLSGINFDYVNGLTDLFFDMDPKPDYSGIELMISGKSDLDYYIYSGFNYETQDLHPYLKLKIVNSLDSNTVYDAIDITGSGYLPSVTVFNSDIPSADSMNIITISNDNEDVAINQVRSYGKFSFVETSTGVDSLGQDYIDILEFNDFLNFEEDLKYVGFNHSTAPPGLTRNIDYTIPNSTASYESGLHYIHRFIPENGYGTGYVSEVLPVEYILNSFSQYSDDNQQATEQVVTSIQNNFATQDYVHTYVNTKTTATSNQSNDGSSVVNLDISNYKNFIIDNQNHSNLSINFQNVSDLSFDTSLYIFNSIDVNLTITINGLNPIDSKTIGSFATSSTTSSLSSSESSLSSTSSLSSSESSLSSTSSLSSSESSLSSTSSLSSSESSLSSTSSLSSSESSLSSTSSLSSSESSLSSTSSLSSSESSLSSTSSLSSSESSLSSTSSLSSSETIDYNLLNINMVFYLNNWYIINRIT